MVDPLSLVGGDLSGSLTGPSSSASSDGTQASPFSVNFTDIGSGNSASASGGNVTLWLLVGLAALYLLKKRRR